VRRLHSAWLDCQRQTAADTYFISHDEAPHEFACRQDTTARVLRQWKIAAPDSPAAIEHQTKMRAIEGGKQRRKSGQRSLVTNFGRGHLRAKKTRNEAHEAQQPTMSRLAFTPFSYFIGRIICALHELYEDAARIRRDSLCFGACMRMNVLEQVALLRQVPFCLRLFGAATGVVSFQDKTTINRVSIDASPVA